jgi:ABC-type sugar transport system ATPase subunit
VRTLAANDVAVMVITHDLETVLQLADRVVVLRLGTITFDGPASDLSQSALIHAMAGFPFTVEQTGAPRANPTPHAP